MGTDLKNLLHFGRTAVHRADLSEQFRCEKRKRCLCACKAAPPCRNDCARCNAPQSLCASCSAVVAEACYNSNCDLGRSYLTAVDPATRNKKKKKVRNNEQIKKAKK